MRILLRRLPVCLVAALAAAPAGHAAVTSFPVRADHPPKVLTLYIVRHAEKDTHFAPSPKRDPEQQDRQTPLTPESRARTLAGLLKDRGVTQVITCEEFKRTRATVQPLVLLLKARHTPFRLCYVHHRDELTSILAQVQAMSDKDVALVVTHTTVIPGLVQALAHQKVQVREQDYDDLFVLTRHRGPKQPAPFQLDHRHFGRHGTGSLPRAPSHAPSH